jgi:poly(3-hydroxybutyrate) depolymerase
MTSFLHRSVVALLLCSACAEPSTGNEIDTNSSIPGAFPDAGLPGALGGGGVLPVSDASTAPPTSTGVIPPSTPVTSGVPPLGVNPGITIPTFPGRDAGLPTGPGGLTGGGTTPPATPGVATMCPSAASGMAGSTSDLTLNGRKYTLHIGKTVKPSEPAPLVFSLHGLTMTPALMEAMAGWDPIADKEGIIIARPLGVGNQAAWDISGPTDFDLMKAIIEDVNSKACVDRKRIFVTGFSMGGLMSFAMACKQGDIFAASAPNSGSGSAARGCVARAVPLFAFHGDADMVVAYSGGKAGVDSWVTHDKCMGSPTTFMVGTANCQDWNMCADGSEVKFCTVPGGGHTYTRAATQAIWDFFKVHPLP